MDYSKSKAFILISTPLIGLALGYIADVSNPSTSDWGAIFGFILGLGVLLIILFTGNLYGYFIRNKNYSRTMTLAGYLLPWILWIIYMTSAAVDLRG